MADVDIDTALDWRGRTVVDRDGEKIGTLEEIYLEEGNDRPEWAAVRTGLFGLRQTFIPLSEATLAGEELRVPYEKELVKEAPNIDPDVALSADEEAALYRHYGRSTADPGAPGEEAPSSQDERLGGEEGPTPAEGVGEDPGAGRAATAGEAPESSSSQPAMTRSEEEARIRGESRPTQRVKLKKYVVTDM
jgi:sporulation protein YlmC with PRC-barrel domain